VSLNEQATNPKSHTSVRTLILSPLLSCHLQNPMVDLFTNCVMQFSFQEPNYGLVEGLWVFEVDGMAAVWHLEEL